MTFTSHHLVINGRRPNFKGELSTLKHEDHYDYNGAHYIIHNFPEAEEVGNETYWFYTEFGRGVPRSSKVYNTETGGMEDNPRTSSQIEPNQQVFALYSRKFDALYVWGGAKVTHMIQAYLTERLQHINAVVSIGKFLSEKRFIESINTVRSMRFVAKHSLFGVKPSTLLDIDEEERDIQGLDLPSAKETSLDIKYGHAPKSVFHSAINLLRKNKIECMVCVGAGNSHIDKVFNTDAFSEKVPVNAKKNKQGTYDPEEVRKKLMEKVYEASS